MKLIEKGDDDTLKNITVLELTERNLRGLLEKLSIEGSARTLIDGESKIAVRAVKNEEHYSNRPAGIMYMPGKGYE